MATRTFHSTAILRHLFTVHASLAEFDLATNALNSYFEIVTRTKARVEKAGKQSQVGLDDDETVLRTTVEAIEFLCQYGGAKESEKAQELAASLENWLNKHLGSTAELAGEVGASIDQSHNQPGPPAGFIIAAAYRAIGISHAQWARHTFEASKRVEARQSALASLEKALEPSLGDKRRLDTLYTLAFVNAESRNIDIAIQYAKAALEVGIQDDSPNGLNVVTASIQRTNSLGTTSPNAMIKIFHLLALLLSARQEFGRALSFCEAAFEDFLDDDGELEVPREQLARLTPSEKQDLIEIKLTQISLIEILEDPEVAINATGELLSLYTALFNHINFAAEEAAKTSQPQRQPPASRSTIRSFRGSIFSRSRDPSVGRPPYPSETINSHRPSDEDTAAPTISVTDNDSSIMPPPSRYSQSLAHSTSKKLQKRASRRSLANSQKSRISSAPRPATATTAGKSSATRAVSMQNPSINVSSPPRTPNGVRRSEQDDAIHDNTPTRPRTSSTAKPAPETLSKPSPPRPPNIAQASTNNFTLAPFTIIPVTAPPTSLHSYPPPSTPHFPPRTHPLHSI